MKIYKKRIFTFVLIFLCILQTFLLFTSFVSAQDDVSYTFNNEILYDDTNITFDTEYNIRNPDSFSGLYNATYSFTNDTIGTNPIGWNVYESGGSLNVISFKNGHNKVVEFNDTDNSDDVYMSQDFTAKTNGTIEFWISSNDATFSTNVRLYESSGGTQALVIKIDDDSIQYYDTSWNILTDAYDDTWYHFRLDFECGAGAYKGLAPDTYDLYVNGILFSNLDFRNAVSSIEQLFLTSANIDSNYKSFFDGIGYSFDDNYTIGSNKIPIIYTDNTIIQKDKFEFDFFNQSNIYQDGFDNDSYTGWSEFEYDVHGEVSIAYDIDDIGIEILTHGVDIDKEWGIEKDFNLNDNIYNVSWKWKISNAGGLGSNYSTVIYNSDDTITASIDFIIVFDSPLTINIIYTNWNGQTALLSLARFFYDVYMDCNLYLNYNDGIAIFKWSRNGIFNDSYTLPIEPNRNGISKIMNIVKNSPLIIGSTRIQLDNIGVYEKGLSISDDISYLNLEIGLFPVKWFYDRHNIFKIQMEGTYEIHPTVQEFNPTALGFSDLILFNNITSYSSSLEIYNINDYYYNPILAGIGIFSPWLTFHINGNTSLNNYLEITGTSLNSEGNKYWQIFEHDNININENYFSVVSNKLSYTHNSDDGLLEYIQITFNITEISTTNAFISFNSVKTGNAFGNFIIGFNDSSSNIIEFTNTRTNYQVLLSQNKIITQFSILISDNDDLTSDFTSGNMYNIKLRYTLTPVSITILTLIGMMIPLIIILTPSLAISTSYGKNLIVPLFILFSIICLIGLLIPFWLFFIIGLSVISFLFINKDDLKEVIV